MQVTGDNNVALEKYKLIIFDFDGVLADTNPVRIEGFRTLFGEYPKQAQQAIVDFCSENGGLSRYAKIEHFFNDIIGKRISSEEVMGWAEIYSDIVIADVIAAAPILGAVDFLNYFKDKYNYAVISGSDERELRVVCRQRGIHHFFDVIFGSPTSKDDNILRLLRLKGWKKKDCVLIGDSINDLRAAKETGIDFIGKNSGMKDWSKEPGSRFFNNFLELLP